MGSEIELLLKQEELGPGLAEDVPGLSIIYIMGMTCDNCLRMEVDIFRTKVAELKALNVTPIMVFGNIEKTHCDSQAIMSPLTAKLKCPLPGGEAHEGDHHLEFP